MTLLPELARSVALVMAVVIGLTSLPFNAAQAGVVTTDQVIAQSAQAGDRDRVKSFLAREEIRSQMESLGVDPDEATRRVDGLSDDELSRIAGQIDQMPAGGDVFILVIAAGLALLLLLVVLDLLGVTDVFPVIKSQRSS